MSDDMQRRRKAGEVPWGRMSLPPRTSGLKLGTTNVEVKTPKWLWVLMLGVFVVLFTVVGLGLLFSYLNFEPLP